MVQYRPFLKHGAYSAIVYIDGTYYFAEDYEGNRITEGINATTVIQAAIDNLPASGGKVLLSKGTFTINTALTIPNNIILEGYGWSSILKLAAGTDDRMIENENFTDALDTTPGSLDCKIRIANLSLDSDSQNTSGKHALDMTGVNFVELENIKIQNSCSFSAILRSCTNFFVHNLYCYSTGAAGRDGLKLWDSRQGVVNGVYGETADDLFSIGAKNFNVYDVGVSNVVGKSTMANLFKLVIEDTPGANAKIENITINNIICQYALWRGLSIEDCGTARTIKGVTINNVTIEDADDAGITLGTTTERIALSNINIVSAGNRGINVGSSCKYVNISNFYIENWGNITASEHGILIDANAENIIISNGSIRNGDGNAITLNQCGDGCIIGNVNADGGTSIGCQLIGTIPHFTLTGNHFKSSGSALHLSGNLNDGAIVGNDIDGTLTDTASKTNVIIASNA